jgi:hypothetical protein
MDKPGGPTYSPAVRTGGVTAISAVRGTDILIDLGHQGRIAAAPEGQNRCWRDRVLCVER